MADQTDAQSTSDGVIDRLGRRIRSLRKAQPLTVQELADRSGVSRRLLTQIELGQANPSLVTVDRIAKVLGVDFAALTAPREADPGVAAVRTIEQATLIWSSPFGSTAHLLITSEHSGGPELWRWRLLPQDRYVASPDPSGSEELFVVHEGSLDIVADGAAVTVPTGGSARLRSDREYRYENRGPETLVFNRVVAVSRT
ncbi:XRE family transcriptional regulator [Microbacterium sp. cx-55]|uniref:helix-turn-helix domain-containing protein n=1 Tax=unclassified Microbacterium TaxID=2609290 RepID=UPI001CBA932D|nr:MULTISPECIES: XRE family transcriptional regulator [unclassified Microbacterium]MBZ4486746.1 XRE family transcriptional regulator [Microbacterium sp. cx-55]MCC4907723.1 XRE family transcriptional regulator [Microbacterium sp. cx-59]UGB36297.1 XRE family transcriptional regulator [Microbacterium sp. cx-55]